MVFHDPVTSWAMGALTEEGYLQINLGAVCLCYRWDTIASGLYCRQNKEICVCILTIFI
jgi:hypothetical protein